MLEIFIRGAIIGLIATGTPFLYKLGKKKKAAAIQKGKIYYGLLGCRVLFLFLLGVISSEMILMVVLGDNVDNEIAVALMLFVALIFTVIYVLIYIKMFKKKLMMHQDNVVFEDEKETENINREDITHICLSNADEQSTKFGDWHVYGKDVRVQSPSNFISVEKIQSKEQPQEKEFNAYDIAKTLSDKCAKTVIQINRKCCEIGIDYNDRKLAIATFAYFFAQWTYDNKDTTFIQVAEVQRLYKEQFNKFNKVAFQDDSYKSVIENEQMFAETLESFLCYAKEFYNSENDSFSRKMIERYIIEFIENESDIATLKKYL